MMEKFSFLLGTDMILRMENPDTDGDYVLILEVIFTRK